jgi:hypothetical protein
MKSRKTKHGFKVIRVKTNKENKALGIIQVSS